MDDLIKRSDVLNVLKMASFGGTITDAIEDIPAVINVRGVSMTKGDEIRNMSEEQLAEFLDKLTAACYDDSIGTYCPLFDNVCGGCNKNLILNRLREQTSTGE